MSSTSGPRLTPIGWFFILVFIAACTFGAWQMLREKPIGGTRPAANPSPAAGAPREAVEIGIAYGTEKKRWLTWAAEEFAKTPQGKSIRINLIPMGSVEGAQAVVAGDERIHVWSPASALYTDVFVQDWKFKYNNNPILREEALALSPMVFVMWEERYEAFVAKFQKVTFQTISQAVNEPGGWEAIAGKPEWGVFKFSHTHPNQSNSGLMTLVLMAYDFNNKSSGLSLKDILNPAFQKWMNGIENGVSNMSNSTGNMMRDMVLRGPSTYDALFVYENVVIDYLKNAQGRWGNLRVIYPPLNMWNDNPYYVLDTPWSTKPQKQAAGAFLDFLLSEPIQRVALDHGLRPGNPAVAVKFPESPFVALSSTGLSIDVGRVCDPPKAEVINNLLETWQRGRGSR